MSIGIFVLLQLSFCLISQLTNYARILDTLYRTSSEDSLDHLLDEGDCNPRGGGCDRDCLGVDGIFGGDESGVRNCARAMCSKKASSCFKDRALCRVSRGLIGGTPPNPSISEKKKIKHNLYIKLNNKVDTWSRVDM